jgi:hypothetical protein
MESTESRQGFEPQPADSAGRGRELFDEQAASFEERAGLPSSVCPLIARRVVEIGEVRPGELVVEIGPGTGQIGQWFKQPTRYAGLDLSAGMLREFKEHLQDQNGDKLVIRADAGARWPLAGKVARVVFSSRAVHLLSEEHVVSEVLRVAAPARATLIIGRVERSHESIRARMSREMNERLRQHGFEGRRGEQRKRRLFELFRMRGAEILEPLVVARWSVSSSPRQSLDSWRSHARLGGLSVPAATRDEILQELEEWAVETFGGLDRHFESEETYVLSSLRVVPAH